MCLCKAPFVCLLNAVKAEYRKYLVAFALPLQASLNKNQLLESPFTSNIRKSTQQLKVIESKSESVWMFFLSKYNQTELWNAVASAFLSRTVYVFSTSHASFKD